LAHRKIPDRGCALNLPDLVIKAIIFDLDSCLSAADEPGRQLFQPAFDAIIRANHGSHVEAVLQRAFEDMWRLPYDFVARKYSFTPEMLAAGWNELLQMEVATPMSGYGDLSALNELRVELFLVTSGFRRLQESKIRALGIGPLFSAIYVDAIDEPDHRGKERLIKDIVQSSNLEPREVLIVGDNPDSELAVGRRLAIPTAQTLRPGVPYSATAMHHIRSLHGLKAILQLDGTGYG
jgi:phosphoglycolate phosphatase-like HAD superfamily hydrolase